MFKLTKLAEKHDSFIIHISREAGAINFTNRFDSIEGACEREAEELGFESSEEMAEFTNIYSQEELLEAAEDGYKWPLTLRLVEEVELEEVEEVEEEKAVEDTVEESTMFKLTKLAEKHDSFIIDHARESGDFTLTNSYASIEEAIEVEAADAGCSVEEMAEVIKQYTAEEVLEAAEDGYGWPLTLRLVEEVELEEVEEVKDEQSTPTRLAYDPRYGRSIDVYAAHKDVRGLMRELTHGKTYPSGEPCWPTIRYQEMRWGCEGNDAVYFFHLVAVVAYCEHALEKRKSALLESVKQKALALIEEESVK